MAKRGRIEVKSLEEAGRSYRVLASWRRPGATVLRYLRKQVDLWIPELAPRLTLMRSYRHGKIGWEGFKEMYASQLRSPSAQDYIKPLALLSLRKDVTILCNCFKRDGCPGRILAEAIRACRDRRNFILGAADVNGFVRKSDKRMVPRSGGACGRPIIGG